MEKIAPIGRVTRSRARLMNLEVKPIQFFAHEQKKRSLPRNTDEPAPKKRKIEIHQQSTNENGKNVNYAVTNVKQKKEKATPKAKSRQTTNETNAYADSKNQVVSTKANSKKSVIEANVIGHESTAETSKANNGQAENKAGVNANSEAGPSNPVNAVANLDWRVGEIIWAKIKGWPTWPGQIKSFPSARMVEVIWLNDYRKTRLYRTQMFKFLNNFDRFAVDFDNVVGLEGAAREGLIKYGESVGALMRF